MLKLLMLGALGLGQALNEIGDQKEGIYDDCRGHSQSHRRAVRPNGRIVLEGVNVAIFSGKNAAWWSNQEVVVLVGPSCKSTIISLSLRIYVLCPTEFCWMARISQR
jgi:hypothetical protein